MTPENRTIQRNTSDIVDAIANKSGPSLFANKLVDNVFISRQAANNIVQVALADYDKVNRLMQAVDAQIRTARNPTTAFETFIRILRELSLDELADKLVEFYSKYGYTFCNVQVTTSIVHFFFFFWLSRSQNAVISELEKIKLRFSLESNLGLLNQMIRLWLLASILDLFVVA